MTGWDALRGRLLGLAETCGAASEAAGREAALAARDAARAIAPVDTGRLRESICAQDAAVECRCEYGAAVELGSPGRAARPFMRPAALGSDYFERAAARVKGGLTE